MIARAAIPDYRLFLFLRILSALFFRNSSNRARISSLSFGDPLPHVNLTTRTR